MRRPKAPSGREGYLLVEASITIVVLATALVAIIVVLALCAKSTTNSEAALTSGQLAGGLMEEIRLRRWDEKTAMDGGRIKSPSAIGDDNGESAGDKTTFDDIDDFHGWTESPPKDPLGQPKTEFAQYTSSVTVIYVTSTLAPFSGGGTKPDYKRIGVCTWRKGRKSVCLYTIITNR